MSNRTLLISAAICAAASFGAYSEHIKLDPATVEMERRAYSERLAHSVAEEAMEAQRLCIAVNPKDWCNRDMTYEHHLRAARAIERDVGRAFNTSGRATDRNFFALVAAISGWVAFSQIRRMGSGNSGDNAG